MQGDYNVKEMNEWLENCGSYTKNCNQREVHKNIKVFYVQFCKCMNVQ